MAEGLASQSKITDKMLACVLEEIFTELDDDRSETLERDEIQEYAHKMLKKLRPKSQFS